MTRIKICGLRREEDAAYVNAVLPDFAGFIFAKERRRYISPDQALVLRQLIRREVRTVGVFVNEDLQVIADIAASGAVSLIQLHGSEDEVYIRSVKQITGLPVIKAFGVSGPEDIRRARESCADLILLDGAAGGRGERFDWQLPERMERPYILAGGLDSENVAEAVRRLSPWGVDVSSGVETDGLKDEEKIRRFAGAVRGVSKEPETKNKG